MIERLAEGTRRGRAEAYTDGDVRIVIGPCRRRAARRHPDVQGRRRRAGRSRPGRACGAARAATGRCARASAAPGRAARRACSTPRPRGTCRCTPAWLTVTSTISSSVRSISIVPWAAPHAASGPASWDDRSTSGSALCRADRVVDRRDVGRAAGAAAVTEAEPARRSRRRRPTPHKRPHALTAIAARSTSACSGASRSPSADSSRAIARACEGSGTTMRFTGRFHRRPSIAIGPALGAPRASHVHDVPAGSRSTLHDDAPPRSTRRPRSRHDRATSAAPAASRRHRAPACRRRRSRRCACASAANVTLSSRSSGPLSSRSAITWTSVPGGKRSDHSSPVMVSSRVASRSSVNTITRRVPPMRDSHAPASASPASMFEPLIPASARSSRSIRGAAASVASSSATAPARAARSRSPAPSYEARAARSSRRSRAGPRARPRSPTGWRR